MYINISLTYSCISPKSKIFPWCWAKLGGAIRISSWDTVFFGIFRTLNSWPCLHCVCIVLPASDSLKVPEATAVAGFKSWGDLDFRMGIYTLSKADMTIIEVEISTQRSPTCSTCFLIPSDSKHCQGEVTPRQQTACQSVGERVQVKGERCWCGRWEWSFGYLGGFMNQVEMEE